jgi:ABC-type polysaccharide/polyol phosphate export permease
LRLIADIKRLARYRELLYTLAWRDIKIRYKQSVMGLLWAILMPTFIVGAGVLVRVGMSTLSGTEVTTEGISSVLVRGLLWSFVLASVRFGTASLTANSNLVTKIAFPREVFPLAAILSCFADFLIAAVCAVVGLLLLGWTPSLDALWAPAIVVLTTLLVGGFCLILSAANLFYRDVKYIVEVILTFAIFFTPVLYNADVLGKWKFWVLLNPVSPLLEALSDSLVSQRTPDLHWTLYAAVWSIAAMVVGYWFFKRVEDQFAERI